MHIVLNFIPNIFYSDEGVRRWIVRANTGQLSDDIQMFTDRDGIYYLDTYFNVNIYSVQGSDFRSHTYTLMCKYANRFYVTVFRYTRELIILYNTSNGD